MGGLGPSQGHRSPAAQLQTSDASAIVKLSEDRGLEDAVKPYGKRKLTSRPFAKLGIRSPADRRSTVDILLISDALADC